MSTYWGAPKLDMAFRVRKALLSKIHAPEVIFYGEERQSRWRTLFFKLFRREEY